MSSIPRIASIISGVRTLVRRATNMSPLFTSYTPIEPPVVPLIRSSASVATTLVVDVLPAIAYCARTEKSMNGLASLSASSSLRSELIRSVIIFSSLASLRSSAIPVATALSQRLIATTPSRIEIVLPSSDTLKIGSASVVASSPSALGARSEAISSLSRSIAADTGTISAITLMSALIGAIRLVITTVRPLDAMKFTRLPRRLTTAETGVSRTTFSTYPISAERNALRYSPSYAPALIESAVGMFVTPNASRRGTRA